MTVDQRLALCRRLVAEAWRALAQARAALVVVAVVGCSTNKSPAPSIAAEPSAPPPIRTALAPEHGGPVTPPASYEEENARAIAIKNVALSRCETGGGIPAMGFGFTVICLKPTCVDWTREPHFPPFQSGVK